MLQATEHGLVLLKQGECDTVSKVEHAQEMGFAAAVISHKRSYDFFDIHRRDKDLEEEKRKGQSLHIPYFKIWDHEEKDIIKVLKKDEDVILKIDLALYNPDNRVEYEMWYSTILDLKVDFIKEIAEGQKPFGNNTLFTPRIMTFSCKGCPEEI
mmetsp:Transcript_13590/g.21235  ORF Transcript_13590/g.21235 Transcript_13590/m.21235 type:complete len:154 (+) Transcript_13590:284-745(+)